MKKIILTAVAVLAFGFANAQEEATENNGFAKGNMWIEGGFSFRSSDNETPGDITSSYAFTPKVGYMLTDQWAIGGYLNFAGGELNNVANPAVSDKFGAFGIGAFGRYYFLQLGAKKSFQAYGEIGLGYTGESYEPNGFDKQTNSTINANIAIGMNYFFTPKWAATFTLANILSYNSANPETGSNTSDLVVNVNLFQNIFATPQFGLLYKW
jgi:hypothetical protein